MILRLTFIVVLIGAFAEAGPSVVWAGDVTVTVGSQVMAPAMALNPEKVTVQIGDTVTWENLTGQGIKVKIGRAHRLNSSHSQISYAVFCLKKKKKNKTELSH